MFTLASMLMTLTNLVLWALAFYASLPPCPGTTSPLPSKRECRTAQSNPRGCLVPPLPHWGQPRHEPHPVPDGKEEDQLDDQRDQSKAFKGTFLISWRTIFRAVWAASGRFMMRWAERGRYLAETPLVEA